MRSVALVLACFGALGLLLASSRWLAGRRAASVGHGVLAVLALAGAAVLWPLHRNLAAYGPPLRDRPVAQVYCERTGAGAYQLTLTALPGGHMQVFEVAGDEWRLDGRELTWTGRAAELGLRPGFRLDRLQTRQLAAAAPGGAPAASYSFGSGDDGLDVWESARTGGIWARFAAAVPAPGAWWPLVPDQRYDVWLVGDRLEARPATDAGAPAARR